MPTLTLAPKRRYLVRFEPKRVPHTFADVLILGGGIAGIRAAMEIDPRLETIVVTKDALSESNSTYAQGGIAGVLDPLDNVANHAADTIAAGKGLCDSEIVDMVVREAPERIRELIRLGAEFDTADGEIALTQEGGHSHRRVAHALGDATGKEVMRAMHQRIRSQQSVQLWETTFLIDLLTHEGACRGAIVWNPRHGKTMVWAKQTILCTGGAGQLYRETTNPAIATADGHAAAFRAGVRLRDMEFVQFHPTVLYIAGSSRHLISEAVRGEGAILRDAAGERFMEQYDPALELAPRDVVSRSITAQMAKTRHPCVYLDLTHISPDLVRERFPHIGKVCSDFGLDITRDLIPVRPGAHYMIGGATVDADAATSLPGLWAAGESTSSGLHGANRLGSNSLLEGLVFGLKAGRGASQLANDQPDNFTALPLASDWIDEKIPLLAKGGAASTLPLLAKGGPGGGEQGVDEELNLTDLRNSLTSLMWRNVGIERDAETLSAAAAQVEFWDRYVSRREFADPRGWELQNLLLVARLVIAAATERKESRGVHFRTDFPKTLDEQRHGIEVVSALG